MNHCVVGDVHGEYEAFLNLVSNIPLNSKLIFVGDLIDRGEKSAQVVRYVRDHKLACVRGNHEEMMIEFGTQFVKEVEEGREIEQSNVWLDHGGRETLASYGLVYLKEDKMELHPFIKEFIFLFKEDIAWMKKLPLYLELEARHPSGRLVVVSHSAIAPVWKLRDSIEKKDEFKETVLWARRKPIDSVSIFNIFGHTPQKNRVDKHQHYINIDRGAYKKSEKGFGLLVAYAIERDELFTSNDRHYAKAM